MVAADWDALFAVASDRLIWELHPAHDRWQEGVFRAFFDAGLASGGALTIVEQAGGRVIGSSRYDNWNADANEIEIGWTFLARDHWGGATNRAVKQLMLDHIFAHVGIVTFTIGEANLRSRRAIEKLGGVLRAETEPRELAGAIVRHVIYEIRREHWQ